jgi:hypothetical protein
MRCGNWKVPAEMSVGHAAAGEDIAAREDVAASGDPPVAVAVGAAEEGRPIAEQLNPPVLNVTSSQPAVFGNASLKIL